MTGHTKKRMWVSTKDIQEVMDFDSGEAVRKRIKKAREEGKTIRHKRGKGGMYYYILDDLEGVFPEKFDELKSRAVQDVADTKVSEGTQPPHLQILENITTKEVEEIEEVEELEELTHIMRIKMNVSLEPDIFILYGIMRHQGFEGTLSDFINGCVKGFMQDRGYVVIIAIPEG